MSDDPQGRYGRAVASLQDRGRFGIRLGLGRTRALLAALGEPHRSIRGVLVAGTNGKGSVQALVSTVLRAAGIHIGQTPKPHLVSYRERILIDGRPIAAADLADLVERVMAAADAMPARLGPATEFELVTAAAFDWFRSCDVSTAVVEVGLGGRLDATNAWDGGVAAITTVALDHTALLGPTLTHIGREKAGIIKRGDLAVSGATGEGAAPIRRRAQRLGVSLREVVALPMVTMDRAGIQLRHPELGDLRVSLLGRHQAHNVAVALAVVEALDQAGIARVPERAIRDGLAETRWPGRLELLAVSKDGRVALAGTAVESGCVDLLLDGAHNVEGAMALASSVDDLRAMLAGGRPVLLVGMLADKDFPAILAALMTSRTLSGALHLATSVPGSARSLDSPALAQAWAALTGEPSPAAIADADEALDRGLAEARRAGGPIIVCGSLHLVGHVRRRLMPDADLDHPPTTKPGTHQG